MTHEQIPGIADLQDAMDRDDQRARMYLRAAARRSFFFMTKAVAGFMYRPNDFDAEVFKERQEWVQHVLTVTKRGLMEDARNMAKSGGTTVPIPLWLAVQRPHATYDHPTEFARATAYMQEHLSLRGVDSRLVIYSDSKKTAGRWVDQSRAHLDSNPFLRWLYPELLWEDTNKLPPGLRYNSEEYYLPGRLNTALRDGFLRAAGVDSKEQGGRAEGILVEDIVGEQSYRSEPELRKRRENIRTIQMLLEFQSPAIPQGGFVLINGNRWALMDVNSMIHEMGGWDIWRRRIYRCYVHGAGNCGPHPNPDAAKVSRCSPTDEPLWKKRFPDRAAVEAYARLVGPEAFAAQGLNDPTQASVLDARLVNYFALDVAAVDGRRTWALLWEGEDKVEQRAAVSSLAVHVISIDPASSKESTAARSAISWIALDAATRRRYWIECLADRWDPATVIDKALDLFVKVREMTGTTPRLICEKAGQQDYVGTAIRAQARARRISRVPEVEMIPVPHGLSKQDRQVRRLGNLLNLGQLWIRHGLALPVYEMQRVPVGTCDTLDSAAQAEDVFAPRGFVKDAENLRKRRAAVIAARRAAAGTAGVPL